MKADGGDGDSLHCLPRTAELTDISIRPMQNSYCAFKQDKTNL